MKTHLINFTINSNQINNSKNLISEIVDDLLLKISKLDVEEQKLITFQCHPIESNSDKNPVVQLVIYNIKNLDTANQLVKLYQIKNERFNVHINENQ
jgi:hypothetical protein